MTTSPHLSNPQLPARRPLTYQLGDPHSPVRRLLDSGTQWYQGRGNGDYQQAACSTCGNGQVNGRGSGRVPA